MYGTKSPIFAEAPGAITHGVDCEPEWLRKKKPTIKILHNFTVVPKNFFIISMNFIQLGLLYIFGVSVGDAAVT